MEKEAEAVGGAGFGQFEDLSPFYDELMRGVPYEAWVEYVRLLWDLHGCSPRRVLDAACGTGNVTFELSRWGYDVVGVDLSSGMVAWAQGKLGGLDRLPAGGSGRAEFVVGDLRSFDLGRSFEAATCLYDSLNYILEPADLGLAFERVAAHVEPGGVWVFDMNAPWAFEANLFTQSSREPRRALHYSWQASFDVASRICTVQMLFEKALGGAGGAGGAGGEVQTFRETHRERAYEMDEVVSLLERSNWKLEGAYDAYTLNPPRKKSERWYFAARRL